MNIRRCEEGHVNVEVKLSHNYVSTYNCILVQRPLFAVSLGKKLSDLFYNGHVLDTHANHGRLLLHLESQRSLSTSYRKKY